MHKTVRFGFAALVLSVTAASAECIDLLAEEELEITGRLADVIRPGPPDYEDVARGDKPIRAIFLLLDAPICIEDGDYFADPSEKFSEVHLYAQEPAVWADLQAGVGAYATIRGRGDASSNGNHLAPLVLSVTSITRQAQ